MVVVAEELEEPELEALEEVEQEWEAQEEVEPEMEADAEREREPEAPHSIKRRRRRRGLRRPRPARPIYLPFTPSKNNRATVVR